MGICFSVRIVNSVVFTYSLMLYVLVCFGVCLLRLLVTLFSVADWFDISLRIGLLRTVVIVDFVVLGLVFWLPCGFGCVTWFAGGYC